uniref:Arf-GAP with Rho-GAP domain, ANK repeat and PH domain-containing protein 2 n=1 Tax=Timema shepardi TaxID=629360 RepID=A0A7R9ALZ5_TIMSH|nr:unnamed protein product [Timema shepardi]
MEFFWFNLSNYTVFLIAMNVIVPVPKPRHTPSPHINSVPILETPLKKPVPLPRHKGTSLTDNVISKETIIGNDEVCQENQVIPLVHGSLKGGTEMDTPKTTSKNLSDSMQIKGKSVIESTRNVSLRLEKSVRSIISKRRTVQQTFLDNHSVKFERSQSLPSENIFQSISFHSPFTTEEEESEKAEDDYGVPPPIYPPPPLPDESVYDELQSVISGHSSSCNDPYSSPSDSCIDTDSIYEDISFVKSLGSTSKSPSRTSNSFPMPSSISPTQKKQIIDITNKNIIKPGARSDSWSFFDTISNDDLYSNVSIIANGSDIDDRSSIYSNVPNTEYGSTTGCPTSSESVSPSLLSDLEGLQYNSSDDESYSTVNSQSHLSVQNELYENWNLSSVSSILSVPLRSAHEKRTLPSQSVIFEFDPLFENSPLNRDTSNKNVNKLLSTSNTHPISNKILTSSYGKINKVSAQQHPTTSSLTEEGISLIPPVPPRRFDSMTITSSVKDEIVSQDMLKLDPLTQLNQSLQHVKSVDKLSVPEARTSVDKSCQADSTLETEETDSNIITSTPTAQPEIPTTTPVDSVPPKQRLARWYSMKRAIQLVTDNPAWSSPMIARRNRSSGADNAVFYNDKDKSTNITRPNLLLHKVSPYSGSLFRLTGTSDRNKELAQRWCVLAEGKLSCFQDKTASEIKEVVPLESIMSVNVAADYKPSATGDEIHCFELSVSWKGRHSVFGSPSTTDRRVWMQKILESLTKVFPMRISSDFTRAGWCFLKEGVSGLWNLAWILLHKRTLFYCLTNGTLQEADLRKAICTVMQDNSNDSPPAKEKGPMLLVDFPGQALYFQMDTARETTMWRVAVRVAAVDNGPNLAQQQLTKDDVPTIVDKCVNFIYAHGSMSEGIYRRSGTNSAVTRLLTLFRQDAWAVQLSKSEYSEYDVGSVLKRFFRDLPEPLFTTELHAQLCEIADGKFGKTHQDLLAQYRRALEQLPPINFVTARKLIGHLYFIHEQHEKNLMPVDNLAAIWGPTLMHLECDEYQSWSSLESGVVTHLISMYPSLFDVDTEELIREKKMLEVLERYHASNTSVPHNKPSGDLKVWIYIDSKDSGNCVNVTIHPQRQAGEVCVELASKTEFPSHQLTLEEVVLGGALVRPMHHTERVLDTVLRWGYWSDADCKDNCLVLTRNTTFKEADILTKQPMTMCGELRFADQKSKSFKNYLFEFSQAKLSYYKDKSGSNKLNEWKIEDIVWYFGHEPKRNPHMRSRDAPYFGCTIAGTSKEEQLRWVGAMLGGEFPHGLLPSPILLV